MPRFVQIKNPKSGLWVRVDRVHGVLRHKVTPGPFKGIPIVETGESNA